MGFRSDTNYIKNWYKWLKNDPVIKDQYEYYRKNTSFPKFFPFIKKFIIADEKIYIFTYIIKDKKSEIIVLDLKGKLLKKTFIAVIDKNPLELYPLTISNDKLYQLKENSEDEKWELQITDIK